MKNIFIFLLVSMFGLLSLQGIEWQSGANILPIVKKSGDGIQFEVNSFSEKDVYYIYYKTKGLEHFQVRKMRVSDDGRVYYRLSTDNLYGKDLEYYIRRNGNRDLGKMTPVFTMTNITNKGYPMVYFMQATSGTAAMKKKREQIIKLGASLSTATQIQDNAEYPGEKFTANGNFRLYRNIYKEKYQFDFDSNFAYMNKPSESESKVNLSSMMVRYKQGVHKIEAGDVTISNTEFTTSYLSRRGFNYILEHKSFYFNTFYTNSQQKKGFDGFGVPAAGGNIFGAVLGFKKGYTFDIKGLFMTGVDNLDSKTVSYSSEDSFRNGNMFSLWSSLNLFKNHLTLKGEFARSTFGKGQTKDSIEKESDTAYMTQMNFNYKIISGNVSYKKIGSHFNSIANLFLQNDREGLTSGLTMTIKSFSVNVNYSDEKTYKESTVQPMLNTKNLTATMSWMIGKYVRIGADFGTNNLDYDQSTGLQTGNTDMDTIKYGGTLAFIAGANGINFRVGKTESKTFSSNLSGTVGINISLGQFFTFNPSVSYQETENFTDNSVSKMTSAFVSSEISFIPQVLTITLSGSYTKNENTFSTSTSMSADGNLNFYMAKIFKNKLQPTLSLKTKYQESEYSGTKTDSFAIYLQADISF